MSSIGGSGAGLPPFVGSVAGVTGQQRVAGVQQAAAEGAARTFEAQRQAQMQRSLGDVGASEGVGDRDADGREAWRWPVGHPHPEEMPDAPQPAAHSVDPDQERGQSLDLDA